MNKKRTYHRENCSNCIRRSMIDLLGRIIVLSGIHAFEWQITIIEKYSTTTIRFKNRVEATKEFKKFR